jgi:hypothetical protein
MGAEHLLWSQFFFLLFCCYCLISLFIAVLGFELRAYTLSHSISPFL